MAMPDRRTVFSTQNKGAKLEQIKTEQTVAEKSNFS